MGQQMIRFQKTVSTFALHEFVTCFDPWSSIWLAWLVASCLCPRVLIDCLNFVWLQMAISHFYSLTSSDLITNSWRYHFIQLNRSAQSSNSHFRTDLWLLNIQYYLGISRYTCLRYTLI
jgi:hypothetical protein